MGKSMSLQPPPSAPPMLRRSSCDLFECIEQHSRLPEEQARYVFGQVVDAVWYLNQKGICHRDIKDENVIMDGEGHIKIVDFGSAAYIKSGPFDVFVGTIGRRSPTPGM